MPEKLRAVTYARQSLTRGPDEDSLSIEVQTRACREYVAKQGWELVGTFEDPDQKGWKQHRPAFDAMLGYLRDGVADIAVVFKLSRFARSLMHQETIIGEVADAGGELTSVTEPYISTSPMVRQILGAVNEQYHRDQGDFLRAAFAGRARRGYHHGTAPIGYMLQDGRLVIDEARAETVRRMFAWALDGIGSPEIMHRLNMDGITGRNGVPWSQKTVLRILRNRTYAGDVVFHGEVVARDAHPVLVSPEDFDAVQGMIQRRRGVRRKQSPSWADGFVVHACGARMYAANWSTAQDAPRWRFRCGATVTSKRHDRHRCTIHPASLFADHAESHFVRLLVASLQEIALPAVVAARIEAQHAESAEERQRHRKRLEHRLVDITGQRDRLLDMALRGSVPEDAYITRDTALRAELDRVRAEIDTVPDPVDITTLADRHDALVSVTTAVLAIVEHAPSEMPALLHQLDVRLVIGAGAPRLRFGERTAPFFMAEDSS